MEYSDIKGREIPIVERKTEAERPAGQKNGNSGGWQRGGGRNKYVPVKGNVVMGKAVTGEPVEIGQVILKDAAGTGVPVIATASHV